MHHRLTFERERGGGEVLLFFLLQGRAVSFLD